MGPMSSAIRSYLGLTKAALVSTSNKTVTAVLGNESCDLDSAVSAIVYAYFLSTVSSQNDSIVVPILNTNEDEFRIKTEVAFVIRQFLFPDIPSSDTIANHLIFRDTIDLSQLHSQHRLHLHLVDHNFVSFEQTDISSAVEGIVDHHAITESTLKIPDSLIEKVGSCTTLIAEKYFKRCSEHPGFQFPSDAGAMIRAAILEDTSGLKEGIGKTTPKDIEMVERIESEVLKINCDENALQSRMILQSKVSEAKQDISALRPEELFAKDTKTARVPGANMLLSTVPVSWNVLKAKLSQENTTLAQVLPRIAKTKNIDFILVYTVWSDSEGGRMMAFYSEDPEKIKITVNALKNNEDFDPKMVTMELGEMGSDQMEAYVQTNRAITRKQVQPLLEKVFSSSSGI